MLILVGIAPTRVIAGVYWNATTHFYLPRFGPLLPVIGIPYFLILGYIAVLLIQGYRDAHHPLTRHRIQYMLQELSELATSILDIDRLTAMLLDRLTETMHVQWAGLILKEQEDTQFRLVAEIGPNQQTSPVVFDLDPRLVRWLAKRKEAITRQELVDLPQFAILSDRAREEFNHADARLFVPLVAQGTLVGILILGPKRAGIPYDPDERRTLSTLANHVATAIENARLYREAQEEIVERKRAQMTLQAREIELRRRTARLELLRQVDEAILEARDPNAVMEAALRHTRELLGCEGAGLITLTAGSYDLVLMTPEAETRGSDGTEPLTPNRMNGRSREIFDKLYAGQIAVIDDLETTRDSSPMSRRLRALGYRAAMLVPVLHREPQLIETLILTADRPDAFSDRDQDVGKDIAHSLALVIHHTEMRREIQERTLALEQQLARVRLFNEITRTIVARYDLASILRVVARRLEDDFADLATIWLDEEDMSATDADHHQASTARTETALLNQMVISSKLLERASIQQGKVVYLDDLAHSDDPAFTRVVQQLGVHSAVVVPLVLESTVFGMIVSARRERDAFTYAERAFLGGLGEHVALAIHQTRLYEEVEAAYRELRETQRAAMQQERLRALGEMASGIAHDINNAISPIPLYLRLIENKIGLTGETATYLNTIKIAVRDVEETVRRMRQFYRVQTDKAFLPVDLNLAIQQAIELTRPRWRDVPQEQGITIDLRTDFESDLPFLLGDEAEIRQAVTNLIFNAVDAMPEGGTLTLRTRARTSPSADVALDVIDTGIGMDEEQKARAFEPFYSTKGVRGSGLGLATVFGTMQRHGGTAEIESAPGEGTTMRLVFPMRSGTVAQTKQEPIVPIPTRRILCIDDEPLLREALKEALESEGHRVVLAGDGVLGLDAFRAARQAGKPFDVVITDLGMPRMDGRAVASALDTEAPETPVIMLTGWGQRLRAEDELPPGVDLMMSKPPTIDSLTQALSQVISED